jgi:hypothetical protein
LPVKRDQLRYRLSGNPATNEILRLRKELAEARERIAQLEELLALFAQKRASEHMLTKQ